VLTFAGITQIALFRFLASREYCALATTRVNAERRWIGEKLIAHYVYSFVLQLVLRTVMFGIEYVTYRADFASVLEFAELRFLLRLKVSLRETGPVVGFFDKSDGTGRSDGDEFY